WHSHAVLRAYVGDLDGYRQVCAAMPQRFREDQYFGFEHVLARTCATAPAPGLDLGWAKRMAELGVQRKPEGPWDHHALGRVCYRRGEYARAVQSLEESLRLEPGWLGRCLNHAVLAMAHHRLGQAGEARQALAAAGRALDQGAHALFSSEKFAPAGWQEWLEGRLLYREATTLIEGTPPPDAPRPPVLPAPPFAA